jgi:hypothetical protein
VDVVYVELEGLLDNVLLDGTKIEEDNIEFLNNWHLEVEILLFLYVLIIHGHVSTLLHVFIILQVILHLNTVLVLLIVNVIVITVYPSIPLKPFR